MNHSPAPSIDWKDGVPVATRYDDPYYSMQDGLAESQHVFLGGNDLPARFTDGFHIAELGFGTGLNLMVAWAAAPCLIRVSSFEAFAMPRDDMARALAAFPAIAPQAEAFLDVWRDGAEGADLPGLTFRLIRGDARQTLACWDGVADAWFLDGFSPAKNPELWLPELMAEVSRHTAPSGTFATYTAAGHVRRALTTAGFAVTKTKGFAGKRHMSAGVLR